MNEKTIILSAIVEAKFILLKSDKINKEFKIDLTYVNDGGSLLFNETIDNKRHYNNLYWKNVKIPRSIAKLLAVILVKTKYIYPYYSDNNGETRIYVDLIDSRMIDSHIGKLFSIFYNSAINVGFTSSPDVSKFHIFERSLEIYGELTHLIKVYLYPGFTAYKLFTKEGEYIKQGMNLDNLIKEVRDRVDEEYFYFLRWKTSL